MCHVKPSHRHAPDAGLAPGQAPGSQFWLLTRTAIIVVLTAGCIIAVTTGWASPVRVVLALGFLLLCPGLALAELLEIRDLPQRLTIAVGASLALDTLLSLLLVYAGAFSITVTVSILAAVTLTALSVALVRALSHPRLARAGEPAQ